MPGLAVPLNEEGLSVRQWCAPHGGAEGAEPSECDGEACDMAGDRDGLAWMGASDVLKDCHHASDDVPGFRPLLGVTDSTDSTSITG